MTTRDELILLMALRAAPMGPGRYALTGKFVAGVQAFADRWPGRVSVLAELSEGGTDDLDPFVIDASASGPFGFEPAPADPEALTRRLAGSACVCASLHYTDLPGRCAAAGARLVYIAEHSVATHAQMMKASVKNPLIRLRRRAWLAGYERRRRRAVAQSHGLQCNGTPSHEAYASLSPDALLFFDSRTRHAMTATDEQAALRVASMRAGGPLRLAFSGRLVRIKGVDDLPLVAQELRRLGVDFTLDVYGSGGREPALRGAIAAKGLNQHVRLHGAVDFATILTPAITERADLFICCHPQGDPSCTYLETMACGVPIAGYANDAWRGLHARARAGWTTPLGRPLLLARRIAELARDRAALERASFDSLAFAREHAFEATMDRRAEHLRRVSGFQGASRPAAITPRRLEHAPR